MTPPDRQTVAAMSRQFMESRVLLTAAELDVFSLLADGPRTAAEAATHLGADLRALSALLDALAAMDLLDKRDGTYVTPPALVPVLSAPSSTSILPQLRHAVGLWRRWSTLTEKVVGPVATGAGGFDTAAFIGAMHVAATPQADRVVAAVGVGPARRLLDIGGGPGTYTAAFLRAAPELRATLFDLPEVTAIASRHLHAAGLLDRVDLIDGDMTRDELPGGHDLAFLSAIVHMFGGAENERLFARVLAALVPGGRVVIRDHVMSPDRTRPRAGALFAINMLVGTENGGTYTFDEIATGLTRAGFARVRLIQAGDTMDGLVEAFRP